jgi:purine-nucleoside phosphorylase
MSTHIGAGPDEIAGTVLLPGDPLRARFIAETMLRDVKCYNEVRGMYGYTGFYEGKRVSVQGTGMGVPSISIYANELVRFYGVKKLIRVGTCGAYQPHVQVRDIVLALAASTDSNTNRIRFRGMDFAPAADFALLQAAYDAAVAMGIKPKVGTVFTTDTFYGDDTEAKTIWQKYGILAVEMETSALYTIAAKFGVSALSILTVSDSAVTSEKTSSFERERTFTQMMEIALKIA